MNNVRNTGVVQGLNYTDDFILTGDTSRAYLYIKGEGTGLVITLPGGGTLTTADGEVWEPTRVPTGDISVALVTPAQNVVVHIG